MCWCLFVALGGGFVLAFWLYCITCCLFCWVFDCLLVLGCLFGVGCWLLVIGGWVFGGDLVVGVLDLLCAAVWLFVILFGGCFGFVFDACWVFCCFLWWIC